MITDLNKMSQNNITYFHDIYPDKILDMKNPLTCWTHISNYQAWISFLEKLDDMEYAVYVELIPDFTKEDGYVIILSSPFLVTKKSNPWLIANFIQQRIDEAIRIFNLKTEINSKDELLSKMYNISVIRYKPLNK